MGGGGGPSKMKTSQDRVDWARDDAMARLGSARDFYMPGSRMVPTGYDKKGRPTGYKYVGGDFRTYDEAGGPQMQGTEFDPQEMAGMGEAYGLLDQGDPYFDSRRSGINSMLGNAGLAANEQGRFASGQAMSDNPFATGAMMNNPYLDAAYNRAAGKMTQNFQQSVMPGLQGSMIGQGKGMGSQRNQAAGQMQQNLLGELSGLGTDIYGGAYEQDMGRRAQAFEAERGRRYDASGNQMGYTQNMLPQLADLRGQEFADADRRMMLGEGQRNLADENRRRTFVNDQNRFNFQEQQPMQFAAYQDTATAGTGTTTSPTGVYNDPWAQVAGAASLAGGLPGSPTGTG